LTKTDTIPAVVRWPTASRIVAARVLLLSLLALIALPRDGAAQAGPTSLRILDVPFVSQTEALCGGAAAAMVMRFWGARGVDAQSFAHLVEETAGGIRTTALLRELDSRGWTAASVPGSEARLADEINSNGRPVLALIEDRPGAFHYVVVVGVPERGVIFHDPARSSYRVMPRSEFATRWRASDRWMALVTPRAAASPEAVPVPVSVVNSSTVAAGSPCDQIVAEGVRLAQAGDHERSERTLTSALSCPGGAAYRELAGLRVVQKRWTDAASLAQTATQADAGDAYAWQLLATARFLQDDRAGALAAFNQAGQPAVDTVQVTGLTRTRTAVVEDAIDVGSGEVLTQGALDRARRRLNDVPALKSGTIEFVPVSGGRAEVRATVKERRLFPTSLEDLATIAGRALFSQDARVPISSPTGNGERFDVLYRFRPGRPRIGLLFEAPAPWGGVFSAQGLWERQPFDTPLVETSERTTGRVAWTDWLSGRFQVSFRGGADNWQDIGTRPTVGAMAYASSLDDRLSVRLDVDTWFGDTDFSAARTIAKFRSSNRREGLVFEGSAGAGVAGDDIPVESWFAGDSGNARPGPVLLRAHGLVHDRRYFHVDQMGRTIVHGSGEGQYWWALRRGTGTAQPGGGRASLLEGIRLGVAVFVDSARVSRRLFPGDRSDVDLGGGLRLGLPGSGGSIRVDYGRGLIHPDNKISFGFEL
jgi:predicted double-glycine peptidase